MTSTAAQRLMVGMFATVFAVLPVHAASAAKSQCAMRAADGTGYSEKVAKFQAYEGLLQATGAGLWAEWIANGSTPGYAVKRVKYTCTTGTGLGVTCRGKAKICKL
jgi:hypothetical protein